MCSLFALWISTFLQNFITLCCLVFELRDLKEKEEEEEIGIGMVPSIIDVWSYDREFCSSSPPSPSPPPSRVTQKPNNIK